MNELRDARLRKALESAPDANARPDARVRRNILAKAHEALVPARPAPWWQRLWQSSGQPRTPWNAAFATMALATLVTVLWHDREVPDARPEAVPATAPPVEAPAPAAPVAPAATEPPAPAAASRPARKTAPAPLRDAPLARREEPAPAPPRADDTRALAKSAPAAEESRAADLASASSSRGAAAPAAPAARMAAQLQPSPVEGVTQLRVTSQARTVEVPLQHPSALADLLGRIVRGARSAETLEAPVDTRIELRRQGEAGGVLELAGEQARWTTARPGAESAAMTWRPDAASLQALRQELERLAR
jgi:hypothetical protein